MVKFYLDHIKLLHYGIVTILDHRCLRELSIRCTHLPSLLNMFCNEDSFERLFVIFYHRFHLQRISTLLLDKIFIKNILPFFRCVVNMKTFLRRFCVFWLDDKVRRLVMIMISSRPIQVIKEIKCDFSIMFWILYGLNMNILTLCLIAG